MQLPALHAATQTPLPSFQRVLYLPPNYKRLFLDESWTEADVTQLTWELLDQTSGKKVKVYSEEFQKLTKMPLKFKRPPFFFLGGRSSTAKKKERNWQLTPKKTTYGTCVAKSQVRYAISQLYWCWNSNTQLCFQLTPMWRFRTFFCAKVKMIKGRLK